MILTSNEIKNTTKGIGNKTLQLKNLIDIGVNVPEFIAVPVSTVTMIQGNIVTVEDLCKRIRRDFLQTAYAVRSSCMSEDQENSSMAGQYHTEINIPPRGLEDAIRKVIAHAEKYDENNTSTISLIIQKYINADYAGVCFTRNPIMGSEMVFEYHHGIGEDLVSGKIKPKKTSFYSHENKKICGFDTGVFQDIESMLGYPQDIEWCIENNILYFLQTRPITTLIRERYQEIRFLEENMNNNEDYYLEKNEISEIAPRPTPFTLSLLEKIYSKDGPIMNVFKRHHIHYTSGSMFQIIGNELYVNREKELQSLLPAFSLLNEKYTPKLNSVVGIWQTIRNIFWTMFLQEDPNLIARLQENLVAQRSHSSIENAIKCFLEEYETIFELNIFAKKWLKKLEIIIKNENISVSELLQSDPELFYSGKSIKFDTQALDELQGNTMEISDTTKLCLSNQECITSDKVQVWWNTLPRWKRKGYGVHIYRGIIYQQYREYGRLLMIKNINAIRNMLIAISEFEEKKDIFFYTLDEIYSKFPDKNLHTGRKQKYSEYNKWNLPSSLTYRYREKSKNQENIGISPGKTEGYIVDISILKNQEGPKILKTQILSPDLTKYFPEIGGIISEKGGLLSHLAIIARERGIPVIICEDLDIPLGSYISIDGSNGDVHEIHKK